MRPGIENVVFLVRSVSHETSALRLTVITATHAPVTLGRTYSHAASEISFVYSWRVLSAADATDNPDGRWSGGRLKGGWGWGSEK